MTEPRPPCAHPWLKVTCGVCGEAVDVLAEGDVAAPATTGPPDPDAPATDPDGHALFIVSRGNPELIEQLRAALRDSGIEVIEDRRQHPRDVVPLARHVRAGLWRLRREQAQGSPARPPDP